MKKLRFLMACALLAFLWSEGSYANTTLENTGSSQQQQYWKIKGKVSDEKGEALIGATVKIKNATHGTVTDVNGNFEIVLPPGGVLIISYIGYREQELKINSQRTYDIVLKEETAGLDEVVVTALGIKRDRKALGYAVSDVKGKELEKAKETNVINALAGKIPGLVISQTAGGPAGSTRVIIRGNTSLTGSNQPLYVVDGVPLDNSNFGSAGAYGGYDLGDGISSINPDDIESMSVLKGPAASALYGSRAAHGVILITTKKAQKNQNRRAIGVEVNSTVTFEKQLTEYDDVQTEFGQGWDGRINLNDDDAKSACASWGPRYDEGIAFKYFDGVTRPFIYRKDNIKGFFNTGVTATNSLILSSAKENNSIRLSYTNLTNKDIMPNAKISRNTIDLRTFFKLAEKLEVDFKVNYVNEYVKNRPALADSRTNVANNLMNLTGNFDQVWLKDNYMHSDGTYYDWNRGDVWNINPYWVQYAMKNTTQKDQYFAVASFKYSVNKNLYFKLTGGGENVNFSFMDYIPYSTPSTLLGQLQKSTFENKSYNVEFIANYQNSFKRFNYGITLGGNVYHVDNKSHTITAKNMSMRETVALQSFLQKEITEGSWRKEINSLFGMVNLSWKDLLYADVTLTRDQSSTLPVNNNVYFYPSVGGSFLFSELIKPNPILSFGKLRASWAQVGSDADPFMLDLNYIMTDKTFGNYSTGYISTGTIPNKDLKPSKTNSFEIGVDLKFLNNRIGLDFTYYKQNSNNQIMNVATSVTSGYGTKLINAGEIENSGVEIALNTTPVQTKDFSWDFNFNFSKNSNKVKSLSTGIESLELAAARWLGVKVLAVPGEEYGVIMGQDFLRNEQGDVIINADSGLPEITGDMKKLGKATWDWTGGLTTTFRYKQFTLSAIFDIKVGADIYSMTARGLAKSGKAAYTVRGRDEWHKSEEQRLEAGVAEGNWQSTGGYVAEGVVKQVDAAGNVSWVKNTKAIAPYDYWGYICDKTASPFIYDNSYVKMRELTFGYTFPKKLIERYVESLSVSFVARNPFIIYKNVPNIDPDSNYNTSAIGLEYGSLPSRRSFGLNVNIKF